jgi:hypothetical protein
MTTLREAAKMALDALHLWHWTKETTGLDTAHDALRSALEQQAKHEETYDSLERYTQEIRAILAGAAKRKPLSEGKIGRLCGRFDASHSVAIGIARAIEVAHGIGGEE